MEPLLSTLNKVYSTKLSSAVFWGATRRTLVHTCPAHLRQRRQRRRRPLGCEWLQVNSVKLRGTIGYLLGVEGGEAAPRGPRAGVGEKLRQPRSAEKQESCSTTEAPPLSFPAHGPWSGQKCQGRGDLCSVPRVARPRSRVLALLRACGGSRCCLLAPPTGTSLAAAIASGRPHLGSRFRSDPPANWFRLGTKAGREGGAAGTPGGNSGRAAEWGPSDAGDRERAERAGRRCPARGGARADLGGRGPGLCGRARA